MERIARHFLVFAAAVMAGTVLFATAALAPAGTVQQADAATVSKVVVKTKSKGNGKVVYRVVGKTSSGDKVWAYKSKKVGGTQYTPVSAVIGGKYAYVLDSTRSSKGCVFVKLAKDTGKQVLSKEVKGAYGASLLKFNDGALYAAAFDGPLVKLSKKGKKSEPKPDLLPEEEEYLSETKERRIKEGSLRVYSSDYFIDGMMKKIIHVEK